MKRTLPVLIFLTVVGSACATAPVQRTFARQVIVPGVSYDRVWNSVIDVFGERNWTIANMEKASGFINSDWMSTSLRNGYFDCGKGGLADDQDWKGKFNVIVREAPSNAGVSLQVNTSFQATRVLLEARTAVECVSTGKLEQELHSTVMERAGAK